MVLVLKRGMRPVVFLIVPFVAASLAVACAETDAEGTDLMGADLNAASPLLSMGMGEDGCGSQIPSLPDEFLAALADCGDGHGKCVPPSSSMSEETAKKLAPCNDGGLCVPLMFLKLNTQPLRSCTSFGKGEGVCISELIQGIDKLTFLPQDKCEARERCIPCENPSTGKKSGVCDLGKSASKPAADCTKKGSGKKSQCPFVGKPFLDISKLTACGTGMHCLPKSVVDEANAAKLAPCSNSESLCVPDKSIVSNGDYIPKTCKSVADGEGRCLNKGIPDVGKQSDKLPVADCDEGELCVPCYDPLTGEKTSACTTSCDPGPQQTPRVFAECANKLGRCVPTSVVGAQAKDLKKMSCDGGEVCVPNVFLDKTQTPASCTPKDIPIPFLGGDPGPGVCIADVLKLGFTMGQSSCPDGYKCTPCRNPLTKKATGLPGCPN